MFKAMPVHTGKDSQGCFAQYGGQKKYYYPCNDADAMRRAKRKAAIQGGAIKANQKDKENEQKA